MPMQETVDMFVDEILEEHLRRLWAENDECQDINRRLLKLSDEVQEYLNTFSDNQRKNLQITVILATNRKVRIIIICILSD